MQKEFNKTGEIYGRNKTDNEFLKPKITEEEEDESDEKPSENMTDLNMCQDDQEDNKSPAPIKSDQALANNQDEKFTTQLKKERKPDYSPDVSPIDGAF